MTLLHRIALLLGVMMSLYAANPATTAIPDPSIVQATTGISAALEEELKSAGPGDKRTFQISTDDNIASLETGDIYRNETKSYFQVSLIASKSASGGTFTLTRINGATDPGQRLVRVHGGGPANIVARLTLMDLYLQGGPALHPIALLGLATIVLTINGIFLFRRRRQLDPELAAQAPILLRHGDIEALDALAQGKRGMLAVLCRAMTERWHESDHADIKNRVEIAAVGHINRMRAPVRLLNLISVAAPLIGLLGTIIGMVIVFEGVAGSSGAQKAAVLAAGIRVKLFSTAFALFVAVPSLFAFFLLNQRVSTLIAEAEMTAERCLHSISLIKRGVEPPAAEATTDGEG